MLIRNKRKLSRSSKQRNKEFLRNPHCQSEPEETWQLHAICNTGWQTGTEKDGLVISKNSQESMDLS
jgi:hypothetical protein